MAHALWMFISNLFAGAVPVVPFARLPFQEARILSVLVATALLLALGVGRGLVAGRNRHHARDGVRSRRSGRRRSGDRTVGHLRVSAPSAFAN